MDEQSSFQFIQFYDVSHIFLSVAGMAAVSDSRRRRSRPIPRCPSSYSSDNNFIEPPIQQTTSRIKHHRRIPNLPTLPATTTTAKSADSFDGVRYERRNVSTTEQNDCRAHCGRESCRTFAKLASLGLESFWGNLGTNRINRKASVSSWKVRERSGVSRKSRTYRYCE